MDDTQDPNEGTGDELSTGFLAAIPEEDRPVVEKYIKDWDRGVQQRFQKIHDEYSPYKQLGDVNAIREAMQTVDYLNRNPEDVLKILAKELGVEIPEKKPAQTSTASNNLQGLPPEFLTEWEKQQQLLGQLAQAFIGQQQTSKEAQESAELDNYLAELRKKHGDFDEQWVLLQMYNGTDGDEAVKAFKTKFTAPTQSQRLAPPSLGGGSALPTGTQSVAKMGKSEVTDLVAQMLRNAQGD